MRIAELALSFFVLVFGIILACIGAVPMPVVFGVWIVASLAVPVGIFLGAVQESEPISNPVLSLIQNQTQNGN